jgi:hypothetical protein
MGVKRLQIKNDLNYRPGYTHASCDGCDHFVTAHNCCSGELWEAPRCRVIGIERGRGYRINPSSICDKYDNTEGMKRYRREAS